MVGSWVVCAKPYIVPVQPCRMLMQIWNSICIPLSGGLVNTALADAMPPKAHKRKSLETIAIFPAPLPPNTSES